MRRAVSQIIALLSLAAVVVACGSGEHAETSRTRVGGFGAKGSSGEASPALTDYTAVSIAFSDDGSLALVEDAVTHLTLETSGGEWCWQEGDREWYRLSVESTLKLNRQASRCGLRVKELWLTSGRSYRYPEGLDAAASGALAAFAENGNADDGEIAQVSVRQAPFAGEQRLLQLSIRLNARDEAALKVATRVNYQVNCGFEDNAIIEVDRNAVPGPYGVEVAVQGELCPQARHDLTVFFVVDFSSSMGRHESGRRTSPGNDPLVAGSCGRLEAARAVLKKLASDRSPLDQIKVGLLPFAGDALTERIVAPMPLDRFLEITDSSRFCSFIVQNRSQVGRRGYEGGITSDHTNGSTNYEAAFAKSQELLQALPGHKSLYFISDGAPTSGGQNPADAGIAAGGLLRSSVSNLTMNALVLGDVAGAKDVLTRVAGSSERVRTASNAGQLATEILNFPEPQLEGTSGQARLTRDGQVTSIALQSLRTDSSRDATWLWQTEPFFIKAKRGEDAVYQLEVSAVDRDGTPYSKQVRFRYRP